jgi:transcriptional regulator with XRE-family HTH domain/Zn-dependent peptidase ImmA (M78 family)
MKNQQSLNIELINSRLLDLGLNQSAIAAKLDVSREIVSKWFKNINFPKPKHLLDLGKLLKLSFGELVVYDRQNEPVVEFRKARTSKITSEHKKHAKRMGETLEQLIPYLPEPLLTVPAVLNNPVNDYNYIKNVVQYLRKQTTIGNGPINVYFLLDLLRSLNIILIPVLWGRRANYRNALYIFLPNTKSSWIFVNLDSLITDFNFWIAHELGHVISKNIKEEDSESFNDSFAAEFLFPYPITKRLYENISNLNKQYQIGIVINYAKDFLVSPVCIYLQLRKYAINNGLELINLEKDIHKINANFNKKVETVSDLFFRSENRSADKYIRICESKFGSPIFSALRKFALDNLISTGFIQQLFDISVVDAKSLQKAIMDGVN